MTNALDDYIAALERLRARKPLRVPQGTRITNDAIALEAGRGKGSIKKSRPMFAELIKDIETAAAEQAAPATQERMRLERTKDAVVGYRHQLEASLAREISLLRELYQVRQQLSQLTGANIVPLRG